MFTIFVSIANKIFKVLETSGQARARRYMINYNKGAWK